MSDQNQSDNLSDEEIEVKNIEFITNRAEYYEKILPALRTLHEHEKLQTELLEFGLRAKLAKIRLAEVSASQKPEPTK